MKRLLSELLVLRGSSHHIDCSCTSSIHVWVDGEAGNATLTETKLIHTMTKWQGAPRTNWESTVNSRTKRLSLLKQKDLGLLEKNTFSCCAQENRPIMVNIRETKKVIERWERIHNWITGLHQVCFGMKCHQSVGVRGSVSNLFFFYFCPDSHMLLCLGAASLLLLSVQLICVPAIANFDLSTYIIVSSSLCFILTKTYDNPQKAVFAC